MWGIYVCLNMYIYIYIGGWGVGTEVTPTGKWVSVSVSVCVLVRARRSCASFCTGRGHLWWIFFRGSPSSQGTSLRNPRRCRLRNLFGSSFVTSRHSGTHQRRGHGRHASPLAMPPVPRPAAWQVRQSTGEGEAVRTPLAAAQGSRQETIYSGAPAREFLPGAPVRGGACFVAAARANCQGREVYRAPGHLCRESQPLG